MKDIHGTRAGFDGDGCLGFVPGGVVLHGFSIMAYNCEVSYNRRLSIIYPFQKNSKEENMHHPKLRGLAIFLALALALSACAPAATPPPAAPTQAPAQATQAPAQPSAPPAVTRPLVVVASDQPSSADPAENWAFGGAAYLPHVYDSLFRYVGESSPKLEPLLAAEIPSLKNGGVSPDGLIYIFKLKPDAKFHDGTPVNADAVVYSYERIKALNLGANGISAEWADKFEKVDDLTVKFTLKAPFADFLNSLGSVWGNYIVNPTLCKANEKDSDWCHAWIMENDAGSGPYTMTSYDKANNQITLERFKDYWGGWNNPAPIEKVIYRWLAETSAARTLLEKGDVDVAVNLPSTDYAALEKTSGFVSVKYPSIMQYYLGFNNSAEPLTNKKVRQALLYSFNYDKVISDIFGGNLLPMQAAVGPGYPDVYPASTQYAYDPDHAKNLLKEAGFENGLELTVNAMHFWPNDTEVLEFWQADLANIGVKLNIQETDQGTWSTAWFSECTASTAPNIGQISTMGVGGDYPSAWEVAWQVYPSDRPGTKCSPLYITDPWVNEQFKKISNELDPAKREALFKELYDNLADGAYALWIGQGVDLVTMRDVVQGYQYSFSMGGNYLPLEQMSLTK
jgi:peptide/nickel transport system substrate-binding protein